jgi:hypothetical protein
MYSLVSLPCSALKAQSLVNAAAESSPRAIDRLPGHKLLWASKEQKDSAKKGKGKTKRQIGPWGYIFPRKGAIAKNPLPKSKKTPLPKLKEDRLVVNLCCSCTFIVL